MAENSLALLSRATQMLAEVKTIDDAKYLMDIASTAKHYARKHKLGKDAVGHAKEIEIKAEIMLGEFLTEIEKSKGGNPNLQPVNHADRLEPSTLTEIGVTRNLSAEAQTLAGLLEEQKEKVIKGKLSKKKAINKVKRARGKEKIIEQSKNALPPTITLYEGDLFEQIKNIPDESVDLVISDPPYMILNESWDTFKTFEDYLNFTRRWITAVSKTLKNTGRMFIFFSPDYQYHLFQLLTANSFFGMEYGNTIIWVKKNNNKKFDRKRYRLTYETIFHLIGKRSEILNFPDETFGEIQTDVWTVATPQSNFSEGKFHPSQKPVEIYNRIIMTASKAGGVVLDPFAGSGTAALSAINLRRKCILIERDAEYCKIIRGRINGLERKRI